MVGSLLGRMVGQKLQSPHLRLSDLRLVDTNFVPLPPHHVDNDFDLEAILIICFSDLPFLVLCL
jgi:hypothetical protein